MLNSEADWRRYHQLVTRLMQYSQGIGDDHIVRELFPGTRLHHMWVLVDYKDHWLLERQAWLIDAELWMQHDWSFRKILECRQANPPRVEEPIFAILGTHDADVLLRMLPFPPDQGPKIMIDWHDGH